MNCVAPQGLLSLKSADGKGMRSLPQLARYEALSEANSPEAIADALQEAAAGFGFPFAQLMVVSPAERMTAFTSVQAHAKMLEFDRAIVVSTDLTSAYDHDLGDPCADPVLPRTKVSPLPVFWNGDTYIDAGLGAVRDWWVEKRRHHGVTIGSLSALTPTSPHCAVVVSIQRGEAIGSAERTQVGADAMLLTAHATAAARRVLLPRLMAVRKAGSPLTPTMREYLAWAEKGKTAAETAEILGRKYSTVKNVLAQAIERLECGGKAQAVRQARANGWL